jgi:hypothetical protein
MARTLQHCVQTPMNVSSSEAATPATTPDRFLLITPADTLFTLSVLLTQLLSSVLNPQPADTRGGMVNVRSDEELTPDQVSQDTTDASQDYARDHLLTSVCAVSTSNQCMPVTDTHPKSQDCACGGVAQLLSTGDTKWSPQQNSLARLEIVQGSMAARLPTSPANITTSTHALDPHRSWPPMRSATSRRCWGCSKTHR